MDTALELSGPGALGEHDDSDPGLSHGLVSTP